VWQKRHAEGRRLERITVTRDGARLEVQLPEATVRIADGQVAVAWNDLGLVELGRWAEVIEEGAAGKVVARWEQVEHRDERPPIPPLEEEHGDRDDHGGYYGDQRHHAHQYDRHDNRRHNDHRHYARYVRPAPVHIHHGRYCNAWHPRGYVGPMVRYGYSDPGLVIVYQQGAGLYMGVGR